MRDLPAWRLVSCTLCAAVALAATGPTALAADRSPRLRTHPTTAPAPGKDTLPARGHGMDGADEVAPPVADLLRAVLRADNGRISADEASKLGKAVKDAIAKVDTSAPTASAERSRGDGLARLREAVDRLIAAATSDNSRQVLPSAMGLLDGLAAVMAGDLSGTAPSGRSDSSSPSRPAISPRTTTPRAS
ncbi:hypothetical protein [Streptomyces nodosus]|uniref:hypothetical protein n=1 Tax=Streptomyces nodosus TaxID=40318 RepID=UPI0038143063